MQPLVKLNTRKRALLLFQLYPREISGYIRHCAAYEWDNPHSPGKMKLLVRDILPLNSNARRVARIMFDTELKTFSMAALKDFAHDRLKENPGFACCTVGLFPAPFLY